MKDKYKYILLSFKNGYLVFSLSNVLPCPNEMLNSNKIYHNIYTYTLKYFNNNQNDILLIINKVLVSNKITKVYLEDYSLVELVLKFIKILRIESIYIKNFKSLSIDECNLIISNKNLKYINAYYIPSSYLNKIKKTNKEVNVNYMDSISDGFMINQDAIDSDALYYKRVLHFNDKYKYKEKDFIEFLKINKDLKTIHLHYYDLEVVKNIIKCLKSDNREKISILIYQTDDNISKEFDKLKVISKDYKKELDGEMRIIYSDNFVKNNLFQQLTYNNIKLALFIIIYVLFMGVIFTELYNSIAKVNLDKMNYELYLDSLELTDEDGNPPVEEYDEEEEVSSQEVPKEPVKSKYDLDNSFDYLLSKNKDTVGWITVNNTMVNYPVVQSKDNDYYLKHDFFKSKTSIGWVFMDFRNDPKNLNDNTIIYGHKLKSGLMFGTLTNAMNRSWYTNSENQIITFNTVNKEMKWKIISIYRTDYTTDYLVTVFNDEYGFNKWIKMVTERSVYNFKEEVQYGDKILTLSTCIGASSANQRMVIHAKLIKEE